MIANWQPYSRIRGQGFQQNIVTLQAGKFIQKPEGARLMAIWIRHWQVNHNWRIIDGQARLVASRGAFRTHAAGRLRPRRWHCQYAPSRQGGSWPEARQMALVARPLGMVFRRWTQRKPLREVTGIERLQRQVSKLLGYLERNEDSLVHYTVRRRRSEAILTAFVESAVNEIMAKRMNKKQQIRWNRTTLQPFLDVRNAVLNSTLEAAFRRRYSGFRPVNHEGTTAVAA